MALQHGKPYAAEGRDKMIAQQLSASLAYKRQSLSPAVYESWRAATHLAE